MKYKYIYIYLVFLVSSSKAATNYYIDAVNGNDATKTGRQPTSAYKTISKAANQTNPGDTVFIMNGVYNNFNISRSGAPGAYIVYTNYPGAKPKLKAQFATYALVNIFGATSYIVVNGLELEGYGVNLTLNDTTAAKAQLSCSTVPVGTASPTRNPVNPFNSHGITCDSRTTAPAHHIVITNNIIHDCTSGGIGFNRCDYLTIDGNTVYNNSWYTIYGTSGISTFFRNSDNNNPPYRNIISNNTCYGNRMYVPFYNDCKLSDGNGYILDVSDADYAGRTLVVNNLFFNNGGSGVHTVNTNNVDIIHNVCYLNSASPESVNGDIRTYASNNVRFYNNIVVSRPTKRINGITGGSTNIVFDYNIYYGSSLITASGSNNKIQDPLFINPSTNPAVANFHLQVGSPAIDNGLNALSTTIDRDNTSRPNGTKVDIGAYEFNALLPVTFLQLNAVKRSGNIAITWLIANEINNAGFEVQRSKNGIDFTPIGFIPSKAISGNSSTVNSYHYIDSEQLAGIIYYRLIQKDRDGKTSVSSIISVQNLANSSIQLVNVYPNPVNDNLNLLLNVAENNLVTITIQGVDGRAISNTKRKLVKGFNNVSVSTLSLPKGNYLLSFQLPSSEKIVEKFLKQ